MSDPARLRKLLQFHPQAIEILRVLHTLTLAVVERTVAPNDPQTREILDRALAAAGSVLVGAGLAEHHAVKILDWPTHDEPTATPVQEAAPPEVGGESAPTGGTDG